MAEKQTLLNALNSSIESLTEGLESMKLKYQKKKTTLDIFSQSIAQLETKGEDCTELKAMQRTIPDSKAITIEANREISKMDSLIQQTKTLANELATDQITTDDANERLLPMLATLSELL